MARRGNASVRRQTSYDEKGKGVREDSFAFLWTPAGKGGDGVKVQRTGRLPDRGKTVAIGLLFVLSASIALLGLAFCAVSAWKQWEFPVLQGKVPGAAFGAVVAFLGMRYILAVQRLKREVFAHGARFSWSNFRKGQANP